MNTDNREKPATNHNVIRLAFISKIPKQLNNKRPDLVNEMNNAYEAIMEISDASIRDELEEHWRKFARKLINEIDNCSNYGGAR